MSISLIESEEFRETWNISGTVVTCRILCRVANMTVEENEEDHETVIFFPGLSFVHFTRAGIGLFLANTWNLINH